MDLELTRVITDAVRAEVAKVIIGQEAIVDLLLTSLLANGHVLIEGVPGTAKTLLAQSFSAALSLQFGRVQFTPDLMPGDLIGTNLFNFQTNSFALTKGPIFTQLLLADEINRSPPKTQAALLQAMNERLVTIDGHDYSLGAGFMVIATQNPIEQQGTYPLPEAQLDRFLFKIVLTYPERTEELDIVRLHGHATAMPRISEFALRPVASEASLQEVQAIVKSAKVSDALIEYIVDIVRSTREHAEIEVGASTRAANMLASASRAYATLQGRDFVIPDDIKGLALPTLRHRIVLTAAAEIEGRGPDRVLSEILERTTAPR
jgi:MoxR-like ATPase